MQRQNDRTPLPSRDPLAGIEEPGLNGPSASDPNAIKITTEVTQREERHPTLSPRPPAEPQASPNDSTVRRTHTPSAAGPATQRDAIHPSLNQSAPYLHASLHGLVIPLDDTEYKAVIAAFASQTIRAGSRDDNETGRVQADLHISRVVDAVAAKQLAVSRANCGEREVEGRTTLMWLRHRLRRLAESLRPSLG